MQEANKPRVVMVGSVTGNDNTVGGGGVYPIADLRDLEGLKEGAKEPISMMDGFNFNGAKAYKDSKLAIMMTSNELHARYHKSTGISFSSIYPGSRFFCPSSPPPHPPSSCSFSFAVHILFCFSDSCGYYYRWCSYCFLLLLVLII